MWKKKSVMILFAALLCAFLLSACGGGQKAGEGSAADPAMQGALLGTWNQVTEDGTPSLPDLGIPSGYTFRADGSGLDLFWNMEFTYTIEGDVLHIFYKESIGEDTDYHMELAGGRLSLTRTDDPEAVTMLYALQEEETEAETEKTETEKK